MCHTSHSGPRVRHVPGWPGYVRLPAGTSGVQHRPHPVSVAAPPTVLLSPVTSQEGVNQMTDNDNQKKKANHLQTVPWLCSVSVSAQTLDSSELEGDGIVLSLEEQLNALSLTSSPSASGPDPKATVALNGTRFPSHLFEDTSESTKVSSCYVYCPKISVPLLVLGWILPVKTVNFHDFSGFHRGQHRCPQFSYRKRSVQIYSDVINWQR